MHEVALATALIDLVNQEVAAARARRATRLVLEIGALSHVDVHALRFAVDAAARGGPAEGAALEVLEPPGKAYCLDCEASVTIAARAELCPSCGGAKLLVQGGDEMRLKEMEVV
ncbi:MAG: hydrogenase maturation nickel metallochaperone HypA [Alphaproteobacteria bacterium]|nr:hydrogenase maturation nickel metallochaperone HypA [Alphaproteobacteria bacterium]